MYKIVCLMGEAGSGKDAMLHKLLEKAPQYHEIISCTTRPMRQGEVHGVNYFYITSEKFGEKVLADEMLECTVFNDWFYGTSFESVRSDGIINVGVFNPTGIETMLDRKDCELLVFWIKCSDKTRLMRQLNREENPDVREVVRRYMADYDDFSDIDFNLIEIKNEVAADLETGAEEIIAQIERWIAQGQN